MSSEASRLEALKRLHSDCLLLKEGGVGLALLRNFGFRAGDAEQRMDLLLHPAPHSGYTSRLFFERPVSNRGSNWSQHRVADRSWWAPSWQHVSATLPWPSLLAAHLRAVA